MKKSSKFIAGAILAASIIPIAACSHTPALVPGDATADQVCQASTGAPVQGQNTTVAGYSYSASILLEDPGQGIGNNESVLCTFTLNTGALLYATVVLFADGSVSVAAT